MQLVERADQIVLVVVREVAQLFDDAADALALVIDQRLFAVRRQLDVDLAFVA